MSTWFCSSGFGPAAELLGDDRQVAGEHQPPQQDRSLEGGPHRGHVEQGRGAGGAVLGDVGEREVAGDERPLHGERGQQRAAQGEERVRAAGADQRDALAAQADGHRHGADDFVGEGTSQE